MMFENIVGQDEVEELLHEDTENRNLPAAMLFSGPEYSGKLSTALELARGLTCTQRAQWSCSCRSCALQRELLHPGLQLLGSRYFVQEIMTCAETLKRSVSRGTAYLYIRSIRKLLRRLDPILWEGEEGRIAKALEALTECETALEPVVALANGRATDGSNVGSAVDSARDAAFRVLHAMPPDLTPVALIRRVTAWLHGSSEGERVVIIENVEQLGESSVNALLKALEEPPGQAWFILTTSRKGAVIPTIRSRTREYRFRERPDSVAAEVVRRVFRGPDEFTEGIREYFLQQEFPGAGSLRGYAERFLETVLAPPAEADDRSLPPYRSVAQALSAVPEREALRHFLEELLRLLGEVLRAEEGAHRLVISRSRIASWRSLIQEHYDRGSRLNMRLDLLLESLYYRMQRSDRS